MSRENDKPVYAIGAFRMVGGLSPWLAPDLLARTYGAEWLEADSLLWSRLAGSREAALAVGPILSEGEARRRWLQLGLVCDFADMAATVVGSRGRGPLFSRGNGLALATYSVSALLTAWALKATSALEAVGISE
jgi:hypothetical protein